MVPKKRTKHHSTAFYLLLPLLFTNCVLYLLAEEEKLLWYPVLQTSSYQPLYHHTLTSSEELRERGWIRAQHYMCPCLDHVSVCYLSHLWLCLTHKNELHIEHCPTCESQPQHCHDWFGYTYAFLFTINKMVCNLRIWAKVTLALLLVHTCCQITLPLNNILLFL